jgi:hypothetical protein
MPYRCKNDPKHNEFLVYATEATRQTWDRDGAYIDSDFVETIETEGPVKCAVCSGEIEEVDDEDGNCEDCPPTVTDSDCEECQD